MAISLGRERSIKGTEGEEIQCEEGRTHWKFCLGSSLILWAIVTLSQLLSSPPPTLFSADQPGRLLPFDLILPLLLFSSGMRLHDTLWRIGRSSTILGLLLWIGGLLLSGSLLQALPGTKGIGIDLLVVGGLTLFGSLLVWVRISWLAILSLAFFAGGLVRADLLGSTPHYSPGYLLPVLLASFIAERDERGLTLYPQSFVWGMGALFMSVVTPFSAPHLTPSFVALGASIGVLMLASSTRSERYPWVERIAEAPFRLVIIPTVSLVLLIDIFEQSVSLLSFRWPVAVLLAAGVLAVWMMIIAPSLEPVRVRHDS